MAIDTAAKRASLIGYGLPFRLALPFPDASIGDGDRLHLVGLYSGIEVADVEPFYFSSLVAGWYVPGASVGASYRPGAGVGGISSFAVVGQGGG